jgi:hypothetical protein
MFCRNNVNSNSKILDEMAENLRGYLKKTWAHDFQEIIFTNINEERFSVLYSDNHASRPNSPVTSK